MEPQPDALRGLSESRRQAERIIAEIGGTGDGTDPFVAAVRATRMPMIITNPRRPDNPVVFANDAFCRLSGYRRDEIVGRNCRFLQGPDTDQDTVRRIRAAVDAVEPIEIDIRNHRKTGEPFWNRLLMAPVRDAAGELAYFFASQVDVTLERERLSDLESNNAALMAELADRLNVQLDRERELHFTLEAGRFGAWSLDLVTNELTTSPTCRTNFGCDPDSPMSYDDLRARVHPDDRVRMEESIARSVATRIDYDIDYRVFTPDGEIHWVGIRGRPDYADDGTPRRITGVSLDITGAKRQERMRQALIDLSDVFRDLDDTADLSFAAAEILGRTLEVSRAGYGTVDLVAETITIERDWNAPGIASLAGTLRFRDYGSYVEDLKRGETVVFADAETDPRTAAGADALKAISAQSVVNMPITEQGGTVAIFYLNHATARDWPEDEIAFLRDIAERTRTAVERRRAEQDLAALTASLEQQVVDRTAELMSAEEALRQSQKMEAVGQLTGGVAHDFNNLLTVIRSSVDLMRRPDLSEERRSRYIEAISDTVTRASKLTGQLLAFARRQALMPETFDVGASVQSIGEMIGTLTGSRIVVDMRAETQRHYIHADPAQFDTAVVNMTVNARDAMNGEGRVTITVSDAELVPAARAHPLMRGEFVAVSIADEGSGISANNLERIFEPFFTTKGVGQGTGLGLSQVFGFVKQSGGEVRVDSEVGRGTTFTLYFPSAKPVEAASPDEDELAPTVDGDGACVLVVEDNADVGQFATHSLTELGYASVWASSAADALAELALDPDRFDAVFSDVVMPGMSGVEFGREIRRLYPDLPIILTSGYSHVLAQNGAEGFDLLHKPYSIDQLSRLLGKTAHRTRRVTG